MRSGSEPVTFPAFNRNAHVFAVTPTADPLSSSSEHIDLHYSNNGVHAKWLPAGQCNRSHLATLVQHAQPVTHQEVLDIAKNLDCDVRQRATQHQQNAMQMQNLEGQARDRMAQVASLESENSVLRDNVKKMEDRYAVSEQRRQNEASRCRNMEGELVRLQVAGVAGKDATAHVAQAAPVNVPGDDLQGNSRLGFCGWFGLICLVLVVGLLMFKCVVPDLPK